MTQLFHIAIIIVIGSRGAPCCSTMNNHPTATALSVSGAADVVADTAASATQAATTPPIVVGNNGHVVPSIPPFTSIDANQLTVAVAAALARP